MREVPVPDIASLIRATTTGHPHVTEGGPPHMAIMPRESGVLSIPERFDSMMGALEYWVRPVEPGDDDWICVRILATRSARGLPVTFAQKKRAHAILKRGRGRSSKEDAGKTGCALHPRSRVQYVHQETHTSIQVQRRQSGLPCAMVLRLTSCSPR